MEILEKLDKQNIFSEENSRIIKGLSDQELELYHAISHSQIKELGDSYCQIHFLVANEMLDRNMLHLIRSPCDNVVHLIRNWKTYDPSKIDDRVLLDDHRIAHAWKSLLDQGKRMTSPQFKDYSLEEQKKIVNDLLKKIQSEMIKRGFKVKDLWSPPKGWDISEINETEIKKMNDQDLVDLYKYIHEIAKNGVTEEIQNANILVGTEMLKRGIYDQNKIDDVLTIMTDDDIVEYPTEKGYPSKISLDNVIEAFQGSPNIVVPGQPYASYLCGRIVNEGELDEGHDIDLILRQKPDIRTIISFKHNPSLPLWLRKALHIVYDPNGPEVGYSIPLHRYGFTLIPEEEMRKGFGPYRLESLSLKPGEKFVPLKQTSGFNKNEFFDFESLWDNWASKYISEGIYCSKKYDGRSFIVWILKNGEVKFITEDQMRDRSDQLPLVVEEFRKQFKGHDIAFHAECVAYDCGSKIIRSARLKEDSCNEIPREDTAFLTVGKITEEQQRSLVFHVHDMPYFDGDLSNEPYSKRWSMIDVPDDLEFINKVKTIVAHNLREFTYAIKKLRSLKGSEGVYMRASSATYPIKTSGENRSPLLAKIKNLKEFSCMVWNRIPKKDKSGKELDQYMYDCVFEIPCEMKDKFSQVHEYKGKCYSYIGRTYATSDKNERGDIIDVLVGRIRRYEKDGLIQYTWMFPKYYRKRDDLDRPDTLDTVQKIAKIGIGKLSDNYVIKLKLCPYSKNDHICPLKKIFGRPRYQELSVKLEYLRFPVICPIASLYRCVYLKSYYYGTTEYNLEGLNEDL